MYQELGGVRASARGILGSNASTKRCRAWVSETPISSGGDGGDHELQASLTPRGRAKADEEDLKDRGIRVFLEQTAARVSPIAMAGRENEAIARERRVTSSHGIFEGRLEEKKFIEAPLLSRQFNYFDFIFL